MDTDIIYNSVNCLGVVILWFGFLVVSVLKLFVVCFSEAHYQTTAPKECGSLIVCSTNNTQATVLALKLGSWGVVDPTLSIRLHV